MDRLLRRLARGRRERGYRAPADPHGIGPRPERCQRGAARRGSV